MKNVEELPVLYDIKNGRILDMARTSLNITGDAACAVIVAASEKELIKDVPKEISA